MPPNELVHVGVCAIVRRCHEFLMVQRGGSGPLASDGYGTWAFPGGWLEFGETAPDAARREETGVQVRPLQEDGFAVRVSEDGRCHIVTLFVLCEFVAGDVVNAEPDKHLAAEWMDEAALVELDLFAATDQWWRRPR